MPTTDVVIREHLLLPDKDGDFVRNFQEPPQCALLSGSLHPRLRELFPDGQYAIGQDCGIYWLRTVPPLKGCKSPDWYLIPGVPPMLDGQFRRSYVLWEEGIKPLLLAEMVSGDGSEEHDTTPFTGKFWVYEQGIGAPYYVIFDGFRSTLEVYKLNGGKYHPLEPSAAGRFPIEPLGVELGIWHGVYQNTNAPWLRVWDAATGKMLPSLEEAVETASKQADAERKEKETAEALASEYKENLKLECERAENERREKENERREKENERREKENERREKENERRRADKLAERLRAAGIDPDAA